MAATTISTILTGVRNQLVEPTARFWTDAELTEIMRLGAVDLWGAILDLHKDHYFKVDESNAVIRANASSISGVPEDCFRVLLLEPRDTSATALARQLIFTPRPFNHPDFAMARTLTAQNPGSLTSRQIFFAITGVGAPKEAPVIRIAPMLDADVPVRIAYNPTLAWDGTTNPVPGDSDNALKAWTVAYARAKETDGRTPDPSWLAVYAADKQRLLTRLTPRQEQDPEIVEDMFQGYGSIW